MGSNYKLSDACVAQSAERLIRNQEVGGANPSTGFLKNAATRNRTWMPVRALGSNQVEYHSPHGGSDFHSKRELKRFLLKFCSSSASQLIKELINRKQLFILTFKGRLSEGNLGVLAKRTNEKLFSIC